MRVLERIDQLRDPERVESWGNAVFVSVLREMLKKHKRRGRWDHTVGADEDPDEILNRLPPPGTMTPEDEASHHQRLEIVRGVVGVDEVAWLRFEEGLSEKEIEERTGLRRDAIASRTKRIRKVLRRMLDETGADGRPLPTSSILEGTGLSREVRTKLAQVIQQLRGWTDRGSADEKD